MMTWPVTQRMQIQHGRFRVMDVRTQRRGVIVEVLVTQRVKYLQATVSHGVTPVVIPCLAIFSHHKCSAKKFKKWFISDIILIIVVHYMEVNMLLFDAQPVTVVPIANSDKEFPVHRIYCVGRNYAEHALEMGKDPDRDPPFFFCKPADAIVLDGEPVPYPPRTENLHHEIELVVAIGREGHDIASENAESYIYAYAVGNDITRRDLQLDSRATGRPWDTGKAFDRSAAISCLYPVDQVGHIRTGEIELSVDGEPRQKADISHLIWSVPEIIAELSTLFTLKPGDLIYMGTPAGVGKVEPGQTMSGSIAGLGTLTNTVTMR